VRLAQVMGMAPGADVADAITALNARLGLPSGLKAMGVNADILPAMAAHAVKDHCTATNPRPAAVADYLGLFQAAMG
jgi:alcohol dehydrogenase class IV